MAGTEENEDDETTDIRAAEIAIEHARRTANARYVYLKRKLPGETYEAFLKRLTDEFVGKERTRRDDSCGRT